MNNEVIINFEEKSYVDKPTTCKLTLKARSEYIVYIPTHSQGLGLLYRAELLPGVFLAASLTRGENEVCMTSIANTNEQDQSVILLPVDLDIPDESESSLTLALSAVEASDSRLVRLRNFLRLKHLNREELVSIVELCEDYNDIFHLPNDKLTFTSTIEHASLLPP